MKKTDMYFISVILMIAIAVLGFYFFLGKKQGNVVIAQYDGNVIGVYPLDQDTEVLLNQTNKLCIQDGLVTIKEATCKDQICVLHHPIQKTGESIICLPNKIVVTIESEDFSELDAMAD